MTSLVPVERLSREVKDEIIAACLRGERHSVIADRLGIKRARIYRIWERYALREGIPKNVKRSSEPEAGSPSTYLPPLPPDRVIGLHGVSLPLP